MRGNFPEMKRPGGTEKAESPEKKEEAEEQARPCCTRIGEPGRSRYDSPPGLSGFRCPAGAVTPPAGPEGYSPSRTKACSIWTM